MPDFSGIKSALLDFAANPTSSAALPAVLGLNAVPAPSDVLHDLTQPISSALSAVADGLYRVGAVDTDIGSAGLYVVPLDVNGEPARPTGIGRAAAWRRRWWSMHRMVTAAGSSP